MLLEIIKLSIKNEDFKRNISLEKIFINPNSIISVSDYTGANRFLESEDSHLSNESFSLLRINSGQSVEDIIIHGTADSINDKISKNKKKEILHD